VASVKGDDVPTSKPARASAADVETVGEKSVAEAAAIAEAVAIAGDGETQPKKTSDKENDVLGVTSAKQGVPKKTLASASSGESGDEGGPNGEEGVGS